MHATAEMASVFAATTREAVIAIGPMVHRIQGTNQNIAPKQTSQRRASSAQPLVSVDPRCTSDGLVGITVIDAHAGPTYVREDGEVIMSPDAVSCLLRSCEVPRTLPLVSAENGVTK